MYSCICWRFNSYLPIWSTGYANEVGEAFRALVPVSLVWGSYAVATAYVTADAFDKGKKAAVVSFHVLVTGQLNLKAQQLEQINSKC